MEKIIYFVPIALMMNRQILLIILIGVFRSAPGQDSAYIKRMKETIGMLDTCNNLYGFQNLCGTFRNISDAHPKEWLPHYFMAYTYARMAYSIKGSFIDNYCDKANQSIERADSLKPDNSDIYVIKAMIATARIGVNPPSRALKYGNLSTLYIARAKSLDASNPRIYLQEGMTLYNTPEIFGGGKTKAKPLFEESIQKYVLFKPSCELCPAWGLTLAKQMLDKCR